ncbi:tyrosine recombinase [Carnobacteriaceae bacterium zg-ZUI252]|nr:tyrosine recombinase [Carnobacteriaceae bacterium zg-ZUI252]
MMTVNDKKNEQLLQKIREFDIEMQFDGLSVNSRVSYQLDLEKLSDFLYATYHIQSFFEVTREMLTHYLAHLNEEQAKSATVSRKISAFRKFFKFLKQHNAIEIDPMETISLPKKRKTLPSVLTTDEIDRLLGVPDLTTIQGIRDKAILEVFYATGLRVSELCELSLSQLHLQEHQIDVIGKGNKARLVLIGDEAIEALQFYLNFVRDKLLGDSVSDAVFLNRRGKPFTRQGIWKMIKAMVVKAGITKTVTPHTLRHSVATHLLSNGMNLRLIQEMLGHENLVTTEIYTHVDRRKITDDYYLYHPHSRVKGEMDSEI